MTARVYLEDSETLWTAAVEGDEVRLLPQNDAISLHKTDLTISDVPAYEIAAGDSVLRGRVAVHGGEAWVQIAGEVFVFRVARSARRKSATARDQDALTPPMPATVVRIAVTPGQTVEAGDLLIALEAMKMELPIRAPRKAVVRAVHCTAGELVQPGHVLLDLE